MYLRPKITKNTIATIVVVILFMIGSFYGYRSYSSSGIYEYNQKRDAAFINQLFHDDWYWLVAGIADTFDHVAQNYVDFLLEHRTNSHTLPPKHILTMKVGYQDNQPTGFLAYYIKKFYLGNILFVDVLPTFRSQGWGMKFMQYAMQDLIKHGVSQIELVTRTDNVAAQKLYEKLGFQEKENEGGFVTFVYHAQ